MGHIKPCESFAIAWIFLSPWLPHALDGVRQDVNSDFFLHPLTPGKRTEEKMRGLKNRKYGLRAGCPCRDDKRAPQAVPFGSELRFDRRAPVIRTRGAGNGVLP
ncbi:hypothetical protein, partial [Aeromonas caviae]|uniref:hypothetical protein n=1 Tax=Aeromonas caviae TaxID=648 RepID=UPI002B48C2EB